ncbi:MAG: dCMP deaminase [Acutalibacteraceae bacterium]|nr:dCMP deaminase [Acutalibacteraceae bacterium]
MTNSFNEAVKNVYQELDNCIILGLTGRTGSGCSTTAKILQTEKFKDLTLPTPKTHDFKDIEERKYQIVHRFIKNNWCPFTVIEVSSVILSFVLEKSWEEFSEFMNSLTIEGDSHNFHIGDKKELFNKLKSFEYLFGKDFSKMNLENMALTEDEIDEYYRYFIETINGYKKAFNEVLREFACYESKKSNFYKGKEQKSQLYTYLMQLFGNNIRSSGDPFVKEFNQDKFQTISKRLRSIIEIIKLYNKNHNIKTRICIDAIRNPYEAYYLKDTYKCFYLVSVSTEDFERRSRLSQFDKEELDSLDEMEYPVNFDSGKIFFQQSIAECLQISDIHLYNPHSNNNRHEILTTNLAKYISLMLHPGLIAPTDIERCMQVAFNAKVNSGCLSRQVGSVVTDKDFYIKAVGWNDPPQGQIPCSLRTIPNYFSDNDETTFSKFELEDSVFSERLHKIHDMFSGFKENISTAHYSIPFCFKDIYNGIKNDKNQVYTRSLHAEENAFLQISKFGGTGIKNGKLFVTASPCELCSKKSYQLGIRDIYYIDPYPGIATSHILKIGQNEENPQLHLFYGAIGNAYVYLYMQRFAIKDELNLVSAIDMKKAEVTKTHDDEPTFKTVTYDSIKLELIFKNRSEIEFIQNAELKPLTDSFTCITKKLGWSGSSYEKTVAIEDGDAQYKITEKGECNGIYVFDIEPIKKIQKDDMFKYNIKTIVKDELEIMNPILSHHIKANTKNLDLIVKFNKVFFEKEEPKNMKTNIYADIEQNAIYKTSETNKFEDDEFICFQASFEDPCLFYTYSIEWEF